MKKLQKKKYDAENRFETSRSWSREKRKKWNGESRRHVQICSEKIWVQTKVERAGARRPPVKRSRKWTSPNWQRTNEYTAEKERRARREWKARKWRQMNEIERKRCSTLNNDKEEEDEEEKVRTNKQKEDGQRKRTSKHVRTIKVNRLAERANGRVDEVGGKVDRKWKRKVIAILEWESGNEELAKRSANKQRSERCKVISKCCWPNERWPTTTKRRSTCWSNERSDMFVWSDRKKRM